MKFKMKMFLKWKLDVRTYSVEFMKFRSFNFLKQSSLNIHSTVQISLTFRILFCYGLKMHASIERIFFDSGIFDHDCWAFPRFTEASTVSRWTLRYEYESSDSSRGRWLFKFTSGTCGAVFTLLHYITITTFLMS